MLLYLNKKKTFQKEISLKKMNVISHNTEYK